MLIFFAILVSFAVGVFAKAALQKYDFSFLRAFMRRFSTPYNPLVFFAVCFLLFRFGHNNASSSFGGAFVIVGISTILGLLIRAVSAFVSALSSLRRSSADHYWSDMEEVPQ